MLKRPLTYKGQIERLKNQGIMVKDEEKAVEILKKVNYYRFTGYALQFRINPTISEYKQGTDFDKIYNILLFDEKIRNILRENIEKVEVFYRTQISYGFSTSKCTHFPYDQHYDENNYYNKKGFNEVIEDFRHEKNYYRDSLIVKHHKQKYGGEMPLWAMVELMSFSNLSKLYSAMYISEKDKIANAVGISYKTLDNHLHCLSVLRNKCAHAARLYNSVFNPPARLNQNFLRNNPDVKNNSLFAYILVLIKRLPDEKCKKVFLEDLHDLIEQNKTDIDMNLIGFPENYYIILKNAI